MSKADSRKADQAQIAELEAGIRGVQNDLLQSMDTLWELRSLLDLGEESSDVS